MHSVKSHERYSRRTLKNDIALVRLRGPGAVITGDSVRTVCLPANPAEVALRLGFGDLGSASLSGTNATLVGWGRISYK